MRELDDFAKGRNDDHDQSSGASCAIKTNFDDEPSRAVGGPTGVSRRTLATSD